MSDSEVRGLQLRLEAVERDAAAWKETALTERNHRHAADVQLTDALHERNLLRRERAAIWKVVRDIGGGGDVAALLELLASLAQPLREGEGLLAEGGPGDG